MFKVAVESQGCRSTCPSLAAKVKITKLAVLFLLAAGGARAESFTYTATFNSFGGTPMLDMSLSFNVHHLLGASEQEIKLKDVQVLERPTIFAPVVELGTAPLGNPEDYSYLPVSLNLMSISGSNLDFNASFLYQVPCGPGEQSVCAGPTFPGSGPYRWEGWINYSMRFDSPITGPGQFSPIRSNVDAWTNGNGPLGMSHNIGDEEGSLTIVDPPDNKLLATPEPNSGLMFGACFLLCAGVALRGRIWCSLRTITRTT